MRRDVRRPATPLASREEAEGYVAMICFKHGRPGCVGTELEWTVQTVDDLDYHLSTLFPPVRPRGYLEVRYLDAQPGDEWRHAVLLFAALFAARDTVMRALDAASPSAVAGSSRPSADSTTNRSCSRPAPWSRSAARVSAAAPARSASRTSGSTARLMRWSGASTTTP